MSDATAAAGVLLVTLAHAPMLPFLLWSTCGHWGAFFFARKRP